MPIRQPAWLRALAVIVALALASTCAATPREAFLRAEQAIEQGRVAEARAIMAEIANYPLTPYLELALAERGVSELPHKALEQALARGAELPTAYRLRRMWLERLARERRWALLLDHHVESNHAPSECLALRALAQLGRADEALPRTRELWLTGRSLPDECDDALSAWRDAGQLTADLAWRRASLAVGAGNTRLARYLLRYQDDEARGLLEQWLSLRSAPDGLAAFVRHGGLDDTRRAALVEDVFERAARRDPEQARRILASMPASALGAPLRAALREQLGEALARDGAPDALEWLEDARSASALSWRALAALRARDWRHVADAVESMPAPESQSERWRYWQGRALRALGDPRGEQVLRTLATERSYYGFLAADDLSLPYAMNHRGLEAGTAAVDALERSAGARRASEWLALSREVEARREWELLLARGDTETQRTAAVLAHRWGWHDAAIRAAAAARDWDDLELRFPLAHEAEVRSASASSALSPARIYAVVRQESAFMTDARSTAGALGLMQLMPATARQVARAARLSRPGTADLLDPQRNLLLGSLYLARLERRYDGHTVLASAAYNAGPGRVRGWLGREGPLDSDVWIEMVPFDETRGYLRAVLAYQVIYAERLGAQRVRLRDLMPPVPATPR